MNSMKTYINQEYDITKDILKSYEQQLDSFIKLFNTNKEKKWIILATGSSYNAALCAKLYIERLSGISIDLKEPYNFFMYEADNSLSGDELILAISQRGTSFSTIEALKKVKNNYNSSCVVLTSILDSPITSFGDVVIDMGCGEETMPYSTKGVMATILTLFLMGIVAARALSKINISLEKEEIKKLNNVIDNIPMTIKHSKQFYKDNKHSFNEATRVHAIGYGPNIGTVNEAETKLIETIRVPTHGREMEAFMHGPIFELKKDHHVFIIDVAFTEPWKRSLNLNNYLQGYCDNIFSITTGKNKNGKKELGLNIDINEYMSPLLLIIPFQILSYYISLGKKIALEKPIFDDLDKVMKSKI